MIQIVLVYDDQDFDTVDQDGLGLFFQACASHIKSSISSDDQFSIIEIVSEALAKHRVAETLHSLQGSHFVFLAYSHGREDALLYDNQQLTYVTVNEHIHLFENSLLYTWACSCAQSLGPRAIGQGCKVFWGYDKIVMASASPRYIDGFVDVANSGFLALLSGDSAGLSHQKMIEKHDWYIDNVYKADFLVAGLYRHNRDALVLLGNDLTLTLNSFQY